MGLSRAMCAAVAARVAAMSDEERDALGIELRDRKTRLSPEELLEFSVLYLGGGGTAQKANDEEVSS